VGRLKERDCRLDPGINGKNIKTRTYEAMARYILPQDRNMNLETAVRVP